MREIRPRDRGLESPASHWGGSAGHDVINDRALMFTTAQPTRTATPPVVAGAVAAVIAAVVIAVRLPPMSFAVVAAMVPLTAAALVDVVERRLPNRLVLLSAAPVLFVCVLDPFVGRVDALGGVAAGSLLLAGPLLVLHLIAPASMGFGDVKAAASLGATIGLIHPELSLWTLCLASAVTGAWGVARRARHVALGPGLVLAASAVLVVAACTGTQVMAWR